jgi:hypothetical protein
MVCQLGVQLFLKGCTLAMCGENMQEENKCLNSIMVLAHKGQFAVFSNKESQHIRTLISSLPSEVHDFTAFFLCLSSSLLCSVLWISVCLFLLFSFVQSIFCPFLDLWLLINPLESSNFSYRMNIQVY